MQQRAPSFHSGVGGNPVLAAGNLSLETPVFCMWGANTGVGKTLVSAGIAASARRHLTPMFYLKPVQTVREGGLDFFIIFLHFFGEKRGEGKGRFGFVSGFLELEGIWEHRRTRRARPSSACVSSSTASLLYSLITHKNDTDRKNAAEERVEKT